MIFQQSRPKEAGKVNVQCPIPKRLALYLIETFESLLIGTRFARSVFILIALILTLAVLTSEESWADQCFKTAIKTENGHFLSAVNAGGVSPATEYPKGIKHSCAGYV